MASSVFIALFLAYQLAVPARYYLAGGGLDERFSWRMFSTVRMQRCEVQVDDVLKPPGGPERRRPVDLRASVHSAWVNLLERGRSAVVDKFLARRCGEPGVRAARYRRTCKDTDGRKLSPLQVERDCTAGATHAAPSRGQP